MNEEPILFGPHDHLLGVITPAVGTQSPLGVLMLNSGVVHRIGPHRLSVKLSRHLAGMGYTCMRFDFSGVGDSGMPSDAADFRLQAVADARAAMDCLEREKGIHAFALFGMCSGAVNAFAAALEDTRVKGVFMFDGYVYRTVKSQLIYFRAIGPSKTLALVGKAAWRRAHRVLVRNAVPPPETVTVSPDNPTPREFAERAQQLVDRGVKLAFLFSGQVRSLYSYAGQLREMFRHFDFPTRVTCHFEPDMDHSAALLASQRRLLAMATDWVTSAAAGHAEPLSSPRMPSPVRSADP